MFVVLRHRRLVGLLVLTLALFQADGRVCPSAPSQEVRDVRDRSPISVVVRTDHQKYAMNDPVRLDVSLRNESGTTTYVARRMFWGGLMGGLAVDARDKQGNQVLPKFFPDAPMPPPPPGDTSILIRLDSGFFYGTSLTFTATDYFTKPGKYSIRVIYKSWLYKESVTRQLRDLPAVWADTPEISSAPVWIEITR